MTATSPSTGTAIKRGVRGRCPNCGEGKLYRSYLHPVETCHVCGEHLGDRYQVGLLLPLIVITILGHILVFGLLELARREVDPFMSLIFFVPITLVGSILLLPPVKGLLIGLLWSRDLSDEER